MYTIKVYTEADMKKKRFQNSIRVQLAVIFILLFSATFVISWFVDTLFLKNFYVNRKLKEVEKAYTSAGNLLETYDSESEDFKREISRLASNGNLNIVIADSSFDILYSSTNEPQMLISRLLWNIFGNEFRGDGMEREEGEKNKKRKAEILRQTDAYVITRSTDPMFSAEYIELWGTVGDSNVVFLRTPLESIRESAKISNTFLFYIAMGMTLLGGIVIWCISKTITDPVLKLSELSDRMAHLDFEARYTDGGKNELGDLGEHMNEMSRQLEHTISELKTANNELKRDIERKEAIESMRSEFISNVSHELKTPIALIQGYAEGLKDNVNDDPESREFYCDVIADEADRMNKLVRNLLTLNQLEFGTEAIQHTRFDIVELIQNIMQSSDIMLKQFGAEALLKAPEQAYVWADEIRAEEVFTNFYSNAVHYCGGEKKIEVRIEQKEKTVRVTVYNTGQPIPEEALDHIWEKFYKADKARTREVGGSGVGLSIVKAIMESMNQDYGVVNYKDGVEFYFELEAAGATS